MPKKKSFDQTQYINGYIKDAYDRLNFLMPKGTKEKIQAAADLAGVKPSEWVRQAIFEKLEKE